MKPFPKKLNLSTEEYYRTHVNLVNVLSGNVLSSRESEILACFVMLGGINKDTRRKVQEILNTSTSNISNFFKSLREKKVLMKDKKYLIPKVFYPGAGEQLYAITLNEVTNVSDSV